MTKHTILIVEDEPDLSHLLADYIQQAGFDTHIINHGDHVDAWLEKNTPALVVLDLMLPGKNGLNICQDIRNSSNMPIVMTTAKVEEIDRLLGLEVGADDYICKPYSPREVVARIKTVLRRTLTDAPQTSAATEIHVDKEKLHICFGDVTIDVTQIELNLFTLLHESPGKIFSRQQILDNIYHDYRIVSDRTVDSHIKKLRKKLSDAIPNMEPIKSIYGVGYKYEPE